MNLPVRPCSPLSLLVSAILCVVWDRQVPAHPELLGQPQRYMFSVFGLWTSLWFAQVTIHALLTDPNTAT